MHSAHAVSSSDYSYPRLKSRRPMDLFLLPLIGFRRGENGCPGLCPRLQGRLSSSISKVPYRLASSTQLTISTDKGNDRRQCNEFLTNNETERQTSSSKEHRNDLRKYQLFWWIWPEVQQFVASERYMGPVCLASHVHLASRVLDQVDDLCRPRASLLVSLRKSLQTPNLPAVDQAILFHGSNGHPRM